MEKIKPKKSLGQHFLRNRNVIERIARALNIGNDDIVVEIGAGTGALTEELIKRKPKKLIAIELDPKLYEYLKEKFSEYKNFKVIQGDAKKIDFKKFGNKLKIAGNLPYNVSTAIIRNLLNSIENIDSAVLMTQKEVADRFIKKKGKDYGYLSALINVFFSIKKLFDVPPSAFYPPPKVNSTVFMIKPKGFTMKKSKLKSFENFLKEAFSNRRKKLKNNLKLKKFPPELEDILSKRAEELTPQELLSLFEKLNPPLPPEVNKESKTYKKHNGGDKDKPPT